MPIFSLILQKQVQRHTEYAFEGILVRVRDPYLDTLGLI